MVEVGVVFRRVQRLRGFPVEVDATFRERTYDALAFPVGGRGIQNLLRRQQEKIPEQGPYRDLARISFELLKLLYLRFKGL